MDLDLFTGDITPLSEAVTINESTGTMDIKIIGPGWGSSGYYSKALLQEAAGSYPAGVQNFIDHPTPIQERERPERSLRDLASVQIEPARYEEAGFDGPGLYTKVKVFPEFRDFVKSRAPFIGMSHRAEGKAVLGEAEGRKGKIIESISRVHSVDYVTRPGAKGAIGTMYESWKRNSPMDEAIIRKSDSLDSRASLVRDAIRSAYGKPDYWISIPDVFDEYAIYEDNSKTFKISYTLDKTGESPKVILGTPVEAESVYQTEESEDMAEPETKTVLMESWNEMREKISLTESENQTLKTENKTLKESVSAKDKEIAALKESLAKVQEQNILSEAAGYASELLSNANLPELAKTRIKESLVKQATAKEGKLDRDSFKTLAEAAIKSESEYIAGISGKQIVQGMGATSPKEIGLEEAQKGLVSQFMSTGMSEAQAKIAAGVRV